MLVDKSVVDVVVCDQLLREAVQDGQIRAWLDRQMYLGLSCRLRFPWVDDNRAGRVGTAQTVQLVHPQHGLGLSRVDADMEDRVAKLDVVHPVRLTVAAECLFQRLPRSRGAKASVAVEVVGADSTPCDQRERVVVLNEELPSRVEAERPASLRREQLS